MPRSLLLSVLALCALPHAALACGGLFCDGGPLAPAPVEQSGERILFEVDPLGGTVTTTVDIQFGGDPASFAWILPVPTSEAMPVPHLAVTPESLLRDLELATQPSIIPPPTKCTSSPPTPGLGYPMASDDDDDSAFGDDDDDVNVTDLPTVGPYNNELIESSDVDALTTWLSENGYLVTPAMEPALAEYVADGLAFLGVKLEPEAGTDEIAPLSITWPGTEPMIPLRLTSVGAEPDMGLLVFIAADGIFESENWPTMELDRESLKMDLARNQSNYKGLLSYQIDQIGGQGFVSEFAGSNDAIIPSGASSAELSALFQRRGFLTRLHGRAHPEEMVSDPVFVPGGANETGVFDLSNREAIELCYGAKRTPVPCGDSYCGVGGSCASTDAGIDGCVCDEGFVARVVMAPPRPGQPERETVVCQDDSVEMLGELGPALDAVCAPGACGQNGECVSMNGFATCACDEGYAAVSNFGSDPVCSKVDRVYPASRIANWSALPTGCGGCDAGGQRSAGWLAVLGLLLGVTRRRARRQ